MGQKEGPGGLGERLLGQLQRREDPRRMQDAGGRHTALPCEAPQSLCRETHRSGTGDPGWSHPHRVLSSEPKGLCDPKADLRYGPTPSPSSTRHRCPSQPPS